MLFKTALLSAMAALATAYTQPNYSQGPTGNAITKPGLDDLVTAGKPYTIEWKPSTEGPISLVLLRGPSTNCQPIDTLAEAIDNSGHFDWTPSTDLEPDTTHYGLMLVVEGSGQYQYSTQFGVKNAAARVASSSAAAPAPAATETSKDAPAPTQTSVKDSRFETIYSTQEYTTTKCPKCSAEASATSSSATTTPAAPSTTLSSIPVITGTSTAVSSPAVTPSGAVPSNAAAASGSASASSSAPSSLFTGAADRNTVGLGAIAAGVLAVLAV